MKRRVFMRFTGASPSTCCSQVKVETPVLVTGSSSCCAQSSTRSGYLGNYLRGNKDYPLLNPTNYQK